ncbi:MAG: hypothetical protein GXO62_02985 [Epsilonproteobacteria bacterium]|nr:hypothetical protein [Campylobacterota bacterium]
MAIKVLVVWVMLLFGDEYKQMVDKVLNYSFKIKQFNTAAKHISQPQKALNLKLFYILQNEVYVLMEEIEGGKIVKRFKGFVKKDQRVGWCKLADIKEKSAVFICLGKKITASLKKGGG